MKPLHIAIDGPVGSGKSDISSRLAKKLGILYVYTGAMYRALAYACTQAGVAHKDAESVLAVLKKITIVLAPPPSSSDRLCTVMLDGADVTESLFTPDMSVGASDVGTIGEVRKYMVARQREMARSQSVVMEGRDIGVRVLPDAQLKIYLTADLETRARRRWEQMKTAGVTKTLEEVVADTQARDGQDTTRRTDPLQKLPDAWELDATGLTQDEVVGKILFKLQELGLYPNP